MKDKLLVRLTDLEEVADGIRAKINGHDAAQLDALAVAHLLVGIDSAVKRLGKLNDDVQPSPFPAAGDAEQNGEAEPERPSSRRGKRELS